MCVHEIDALTLRRHNTPGGLRDLGRSRRAGDGGWEEEERQRVQATTTIPAAGQEEQR